MKTRSLPKRRDKSSSASPPRPRVLFETPLSPPGATDTESISGSTTKQQVIAEHLWKQLAEDIEAEGGIAEFSGSTQKLAILLNRRPGLYGKRGSTLREPIRKKVYRWQGFHREGTYAQKVLSKYQVKSSYHRKQEEAQKRKKLPRKATSKCVVVQHTSPGRIFHRQPNKTKKNTTNSSAAPAEAAFVEDEDEDEDDNTSLSDSDESRSCGSIHSVSSILQQHKNKKPRLQRKQEQQSSSTLDDLLSAVASLNISSSLPTTPGAANCKNKRKSPPSRSQVLPYSSPRPAQRIKSNMPPTKEREPKKLPAGTGTMFDTGHKLARDEIHFMSPVSCCSSRTDHPFYAAPANNNRSNLCEY
jgi:hypothetical protein